MPTRLPNISDSKILQHIWSCVFNNKHDPTDLKRYDGNENNWHKVNENWEDAISMAQCDFILNSRYVLPDELDLYSCITSYLEDGYNFKIIDLNIPTSNSQKFQNTLERFHKRDPEGEVFITDGRRAWFAITESYKTTTHTYSYHQVAFHKISAIKSSKKNPYDAIIDAVFNKLISILLEYKHAGRTLAALDERTCLTIIISIINPVVNIRRKIKRYKNFENQGYGFMSQQVIYAVLEYSKVPITIQTYAKDQSYANAVGDL